MGETHVLSYSYPDINKDFCVSYSKVYVKFFFNFRMDALKSFLTRNVSSLGKFHLIHLSRDSPLQQFVAWD